MLKDLISITDLQRNLKKVFGAKQPIRVVMSKNAVSGLVFNKDTAKMLMESGVLDQIREELWELNDKETVRLVRKSRSGKLDNAVPFEAWAKTI
ncbi:MAG: hypothetical protein HOO67_03465 [Candidatus Peribacteraceae bacterium]|nr:hypothetical protein [Candidatus Peribacteraceae bacterium]